MRSAIECTNRQSTKRGAHRFDHVATALRATVPFPSMTSMNLVAATFCSGSVGLEYDKRTPTLSPLPISATNSALEADRCSVVNPAPNWALFAGLLCQLQVREPGEMPEVPVLGNKRHLMVDAELNDPRVGQPCSEASR